MSTINFSSLAITAALQESIESLGYTELTPVQAASLPPILEGKDIIAQAKTGSGKTAAFGIGLLSSLNLSQNQIQAMVVCPTRELADQVSTEIRKLARFTQNIKVLSLCGGSPLSRQKASLEKGVHVVVGTVGRLKDHLTKGNLHLDDLNILVLDEADRMLDMGFEAEIKEIISYTSNDRQTLLFSATFSDTIREMSQQFQTDPITITIDTQHTNNNIEQRFYQVERSKKTNALGHLLSHYQPESTVVFCNTKKDCHEVSLALTDCGFSVQSLHGDLEQKDRDKVLIRFANKSCSVLVATDVAARGLDIKNLEMVINYELPWDTEVYIHRIGRTGRAGNNGLALSLCAEKELNRVQPIEEYLQLSFQWHKPAPFKMTYEPRFQPPMATLWIGVGKKNKVRAGDILGALTGDVGIAGNQVGKIDVLTTHTFVAITATQVDKAMIGLRSSKIKGRKVNVRKSEWEKIIR